MNLIGSIDDTLRQRMMFRRQFVLAPRKLDELSGWNTQIINCKWVLHAHPDLGLVQVQNGERELTLVGCLIHPDKPGQTNEQICADLLAGVQSIDDVIQKTHRLAGRWILIFCDQGNACAFGDPCGMRTLYYLANSTDGPWCFSQPAVVKKWVKLVSNSDAEEFFRSKFYLNGKEPWWPGYDSAYEGVKQLPPNHYLDLHTLKLTRFWPCKQLVQTSMADAVPQAAELLRGILGGLAARAPLALPLTAGLDSRILLAASKPFAKDMFFYTLRYNTHRQDQCDLEIPPRLMAKLGLPHRLIECPASMPSSFGEIYFGNVDTANYIHGPIVFGVFLNYPQNHICLKAMGCEIARCYYYKDGYPETVDARTIAMVAQSGSRYTDYGVRQFDLWLKDTQSAVESCGYNLLDVLHWEQKVAHSVASNEAESDLVYESVPPYNCRALLELLLSVPERHRFHPDYLFFRKLIDHLWREALSEPINPVPLSERVHYRASRCKYGAKQVLKRLKLLDAATKLYRGIRH